MGEIADDHQAQMMLDQTPSYRDSMRWRSRCHDCKRPVIVVMDESSDLSRWDNSQQKHICPANKAEQQRSS